jgi:hypothetical protein
VHHDLGAALRTIEAATAGATDEELRRRGAEGGWSAAEIVEHLSLT